MARDQVDMTPIESRDELVAWFEAGCKPKSQFRVGTEHEKFPFRIKDHSPVSYAGTRGIRALLEGMKLILGWEPIMEGDNIIGLADVTGGGAISLEPGGQFELSGAPVDNVHQTAGELFAHLAQVLFGARFAAKYRDALDQRVLENALFSWQLANLVPRGGASERLGRSSDFSIRAPSPAPNVTPSCCAVRVPSSVPVLGGAA